MQRNQNDSHLTRYVILTSVRFASDAVFGVFEQLCGNFVQRVEACIQTNVSQL